MNYEHRLEESHTRTIWPSTVHRRRNPGVLAGVETEVESVYGHLMWTTNGIVDHMWLAQRDELVSLTRDLVLFAQCVGVVVPRCCGQVVSA